MVKPSGHKVSAGAKDSHLQRPPAPGIGMVIGALSYLVTILSR